MESNNITQTAITLILAFIAVLPGTILAIQQIVKDFRVKKKDDAEAGKFIADANVSMTTAAKISAEVLSLYSAEILKLKTEHKDELSNMEKRYKLEINNLKEQIKLQNSEFDIQIQELNKKYNELLVKLETAEKKNVSLHNWAKKLCAQITLSGGTPVEFTES